MTQTKDMFKILGNLRFLLFFRPLGTLALIGILLWAISSPYLELSEAGPLILLGLVAWAIWQFVQLSRWASFEVTLSEEGVEARNTFIRWSEVQSATAKASSHFQTFIEIEGTDGKVIHIPAGIQQKAFVLSVCEKHIPDLKKEGL